MNKQTKNTAFSTRKMAIAGMLSAISIVLAVTPWGYLAIPGIPAQITIMHVPLLIGVLVEGLAVGLPTGLIFGVSSLILAITQPRPLSLDPLFANPLVSVLPRLLVALVTWGVWRLITRNKTLTGTRNNVAILTAAGVGSMANTVLVLGMLYICYGARVAEMMQVAPGVVPALLGGIALTNGVPEMVMAMLLTLPVVRVMQRLSPQGRAKTTQKSEE